MLVEPPRLDRFLSRTRANIPGAGGTQVQVSPTYRNPFMGALGGGLTGLGLAQGLGTIEGLGALGGPWGLGIGAGLGLLGGALY